MSTSRWKPYLSLCLSIYCTSASLSICTSLFLFICLSAHLSICLSVHLSICLSGYLPIWLSAYLPNRLSVYLSICTSLHMSICLSVYKKELILNRLVQNKHFNNEKNLTDFSNSFGGDENSCVAPWQVKTDSDNVRPVFKNSSGSRCGQRRRQKVDPG